MKGVGGGENPLGNPFFSWSWNIACSYTLKYMSVVGLYTLGVTCSYIVIAIVYVELLIC